MTDSVAEADKVAELDGDLHTDSDAPPTQAPEKRGGLEASDPPWRIAEALETLRKQVNALAPGRDKASDGGIGDAAHRSRSSDHNPWVVENGVGVVTARDFTHSPATGCDANVLAEALRASGDHRIKYIIWNRRICASEPRDGQAAWVWRPYGGTNPHNHHVHISVQPLKAFYDDTRPFALTSLSAMPSLLQPTPAGPEVEIANIAAATDRLVQLTPLLHRLTALKESPDTAVAGQAEKLMARYLELNRTPSEPKPATGAAVAGAAVETPRLDDLAAQYEQLFATCQFRPEWAGQVAWHRKKLLEFQPRYVPVAQQTKIPWWVIGVIHALEGSFDFETHLHNGDTLTARTVQVPAGRPKAGNPPFTWAASAIDALKGHGLANLNDWSIAATLYRLESYNGFGSRRQGINSPYLWSFSTHYSKGKYVRDRVYDPEAVSKQCGAAVMIKALADAGAIKL